MSLLNVIVPLAGPDFVDENGTGTVKGLIDVDGEPLLKAALASRPWALEVKSSDYTFVLNDNEHTRKFHVDHLQNWYPGSKTVFLSSYTRGAALTSMAGASNFSSQGQHLIVDLADIIFTKKFDVIDFFKKNSSAGGLAFVFNSDNPIYSYLLASESGKFVRAKEKEVISNNASAGVYIFSSTSVFLRSIAHALDYEAQETFNRLFYVCPLFNGVSSQGMDVKLEFVAEIKDLKVN